MQSDIGKIERYIELTHLSKDVRNRYQMISHELREVSILGMSDPCRAASLAYTYGLAKGYRAARAEARHGKAD